ncbi:MAG: hypothetical protein SNJ75_18165 [Gemmataceae bacterium]
MIPPEQPTYWLDFRLVVTLALLSAATIVVCILIYLLLLPKRYED